ncbi:MAG TPA: endonuclease/exonuclease/phosphatase family protein [Actinomycetota bacterium]|nr:endonuclease/exonuclease/phosphatase family protein [Actinomycetota bacterium]
MKRERFRLATFNVHHCEGRDGRVDLERTARVMQLLGADLIGLQELDRNLSRSGHADQPALLSERAGYRIAFHPTLSIEDGEYGIALASREGLDTTAEALPRRDKEEPRIVVQATWRGLSILTTHLSRDPAARAMHIEALASLAAQAPSPVAVFGDLNERRRGLGPLRKAGLMPESRELPSVKSIAAAATGGIDHVLVGPEMTILRARRIATDASDHRPLVVDVEIRRGT